MKQRAGYLPRYFSTDAASYAFGFPAGVVPLKALIAKPSLRSALRAAGRREPLQEMCGADLAHAMQFLSELEFVTAPA